MKDETRRIGYIVLVGLVTLFLTTCILYEEALEGRWREPPETIDASTRVNELIAVIPTCIKSCIFQRITDLGCAHNDYGCLCREFERLEPSCEPDFELPELEDYTLEGAADDDSVISEPQNVEVRDQERDLPEGSNSEVGSKETFSQCVELCRNGVSLFELPSQILDVCDAVEEHAHLPEFMLKTLALYPRQARSSGVGTGAGNTATTTTTRSTSRTSTLTTDGVVAPTTSSTGTASFTTTKTSSTTTATLTGTGTSIPAPTPTSSTGLPTGAKIGIGVAIPLIFILLAMLAFFLLRRRKQQRNLGDSSYIPELTEDTSTRKELDSGVVVKPKGDKDAVEAAGGQIHELDRQGGGEQIKIPELKGDLYMPVSGARAQTPAPTYELTDTAITSEAPTSTPVIPHSPQAAVTRKPISPPQPPLVPVTSHFPAPWETSPGENEFSEMYPGPGALKAKEDEDQELKEMEEEMARLKEEKDRLRRMQSLETREKELRKGIEARKRGSGGGGASSGGGGGTAEI